MGNYVSRVKRLKADELFAYETAKVVTIKDKRLGILYYFFILVITLYIGYSIITESLYLKRSDPIASFINAELDSTIQNVTEPQYCKNSTISCVYWPTSRIYQTVENGIFITSRISVSTLNPLPNCDSLIATDPRCAASIQNSQQFYISNVEYASLKLSHGFIKQYKSSFFDPFKFTYSTVNSFSTRGSLAYASGSKQEQTSLVDSFTVQQLLDAAGSSRFDRFNGTHISVPVDYEFSPFTNTLSYTYIPIIQGPLISRSESFLHANGSTTIITRYGIFINFGISGSIGDFDVITLLINFTAALALVSIATFVVDTLLLYFLPKKKIYKRAKYETTEDLGDVGEDDSFVQSVSDTTQTRHMI